MFDHIGIGNDIPGARSHRIPPLPRRRPSAVHHPVLPASRPALTRRPPPRPSRPATATAPEHIWGRIAPKRKGPRKEDAEKAISKETERTLSEFYSPFNRARAPPPFVIFHAFPHVSSRSPAAAARGDRGARVGCG